VSACKSNGCKIAINTARPHKWYEDIQLKQLGLTHKDFDEFYSGEPIQFSGDPEEHISDIKLKHLYSIQRKWNVDKKRIILFDDLEKNIHKAQGSGFSVIHANHAECGIPIDANEQISRILS
jgi:FMN phosphatase YigB (HAD superfamily)